MSFWSQFKRDNGVNETLMPRVGSPGGVGWFRKTGQVSINWRKKRVVAGAIAAAGPDAT